MKKIYLCVAITNFIYLTACSSLAEKDLGHLPEKWVANIQWQYGSANSENVQLEKNWWQLFNSPNLNHYIEEAQKQNADVLIAAERGRQAELQLNIANASLFPGISASLSSGERKSENAAGSMGTAKSTALGVSANYELDLWGGIAASRRLAKYDYQASIYNVEAQRLSINAAVATTWFNYLAVGERKQRAQKSLAIAQRLQKIVASRYRNGTASAGDVAQQQTVLLNQQSALLPLQLLHNQTRAALAILLGVPAQQFQPDIEIFQDLHIPAIGVGLPLDVLSRRPDMAISEAQLQGAAADAAVARAALLPGAQIAANVGRSSSALFTLNPAVQTSGWSVSLAQTIFAGGALKNRVQLSESRRVEILEAYRQTTLNALAEVDNALDNARTSEQQEIIQREIVHQAQRSLQLTEIAYREGAVDLQALLNSQRTLFQGEDALVQQHLGRLEAAVDLYKALGGGWQKPAL